MQQKLLLGTLGVLLTLTAACGDGSGLDGRDPVGDPKVDADAKPANLIDMGALRSADEQGPLGFGQPVEGLAGQSGDEHHFAVSVPEGTAELTVQMKGGTGDADLYVRQEAPPTTTEWNCRPFRSDANETCTVVAPAAGTYFLMVRGYGDFNGVSLVANTRSLDDDLLLQNGVPRTGLEAKEGEELHFLIVAPQGSSDLGISIADGDGDADLYVRYADAATTSDFDCRPYLSGNVETCLFGEAKEGAYHVMIRAFTTFTGVSLLASYDAGTAPPPPPPGTGACDNMVDLAILDAEDDLAGELFNAALSCFNDAVCVAAQVSDVIGTSFECSSCFGELTACMVDECLTECAGGVTDNCVSCMVMTGCAGGFETCSGVDPLDLMDAEEPPPPPPPVGDFDMDGVADDIDNDDDGDGILDASEVQLSIHISPDEDLDGDGIPLWQDASWSTAGIGLECDDDDADGICDVLSFAFDADQDGAPNHRDLDADGDGATDATEGTGDRDGDGIPNFLDPIDDEVIDPVDQAVLNFLNDSSTTFELLDIDVALDVRAARNLIDHRDGPNGFFEDGFGDDDLFDTIEEVDAVSFVGPSALEKLRAFVSSDLAAGTATYDVYCTLEGIPLPIEIELNVDPAAEFVVMGPTSVTLSADVEVAPAIIDALPGIAPDALLQTLYVEVLVTGEDFDFSTTLETVTPAAVVPNYSLGPANFAVAAAGTSSSVTFDVTRIFVSVDGIPEAIVPGGVMTLENGIGDCEPLSSVDGPVSFPVQ